MYTLARRRSAIGELARWGLRERYWAQNPMDYLPKIKKPPRPLPRPFAAEELDRILALELPPDESLIRALFYFAGLRFSEVCELRAPAQRITSTSSRRRSPSALLAARRSGRAMEKEATIMV